LRECGKPGNFRKYPFPIMKRFCLRSACALYFVSAIFAGGAELPQVKWSRIPEHNTDYVRPVATLIGPDGNIVTAAEMGSSGPHMRVFLWKYSPEGDLI
jgi:hypothetical protein